MELSSSFRRKVAILDGLGADIAVVPECEQEALPPRHLVWVGDNPTKGLGVVSGTLKPRIAGCYDESLRWFVPVEFADSPIKLLAACAFNHRDRLEGRSTLAAAVDLYTDFLGGYDTIVAGDMNNNLIWDTPRNASFAEATKRLDQLGYSSSYHTFFAQTFGKKTIPPTSTAPAGRTTSTTAFSLRLGFPALR